MERRWGASCCPVPPNFAAWGYWKEGQPDPPEPLEPLESSESSEPFGEDQLDSLEEGQPEEASLLGVESEGVDDEAEEGPGDGDEGECNTPRPSTGG